MVIYLLNIFMLSRIAYTFDDDRMNFKQILYYLVIQGLGLASLMINRNWVVLLISVVILNVLIIFWDRKSENPRIVQIVSFLGFSIIYVLITMLSGEINFSPVFLSWVTSLIDSVSIIEDLGQLSRMNTYCFGLLFIINESNMIIRQIFDWIKIIPGSSEGRDQEGEETQLAKNGDRQVEIIPSPDKYLRIDEYKSGRVIGILERSIVYLAMLSNEYSIIGFILAAKAFARFKELDKKVYAEYVLIGTLASILIALVAASFVAALVD